VHIETAEKKFKESSPHPIGNKLIRRKIMKHPETDILQTNGFFPQFTHLRRSKREYQRLLVQFKEGPDSSPKRWQAAEMLGNYPQAIDILLETLPTANIDLTLFICKALAQIKDKKAIGQLLEKWEMAPDGSPGTRYIPDVLAAIGDPSVIPELVAKLKYVRFDYRFHIAHALGKLGGPLARRTLEDLAQHDPFPAVREEAKEALKRLASGSKNIQTKNK
jgi:HEAT repeat protein